MSIYGMFNDPEASNTSPLLGGSLPDPSSYALDGGLQAIAPLIGPQRAPVGIGQIVAALGGGMSTGRRLGEQDRLRQLLSAYQLQKNARDERKAAAADAQVEMAAKELDGQGKTQEAAWLRAGGVSAFNEMMKSRMNNDWTVLGGGALPGVTGPTSVPAGGATASGGTATVGAVPEIYRPYVQDAAETYGVNPVTLGNMLMAESDGRNSATSPKGARGVMQFMPATATQYGVDVTDPQSSIEGAARYLADLKKQFGGDERKAVAAYNAGPGRVSDAGGDVSRLPAETQGYVEKVLGPGPVQVADAGNDGWKTIFNRKTGKVLEVSPDGTQIRKPQSEASLGLQPIYGKDENGRDVILQISDDGKAVKTALPEGVTINNGAQKVDLGTAFGVLDRNGNLVSTISKDVAGVEVQKGRGETQAKREADAPKSFDQAGQTIAAIDGVLNHPGLYWGTGMLSMIPAIPGTPIYDFAQRVEQLKGKAFLQAFESLKGGGAITEIEGQKATNAIARLDRAQSEDAFKEALGELRDIATLARERAGRLMNQTAAGAAPQGVQQAAPVRVLRFDAQGNQIQ